MSCMPAMIKSSVEGVGMGRRSGSHSTVSVIRMACVSCITFKPTVTFHRWSDVPSGRCVWGPCVTIVGLVVYQYVNTGGLPSGFGRGDT